MLLRSQLGAFHRATAVLLAACLVLVVVAFFLGVSAGQRCSAPTPPSLPGSGISAGSAPVGNGGASPLAPP